jgi:hypothetical protein
MFCTSCHDDFTQDEMTEFEGQAICENCHADYVRSCGCCGWRFLALEDNQEYCCEQCASEAQAEWHDTMRHNRFESMASRFI